MSGRDKLDMDDDELEDQEHFEHEEENAAIEDEFDEDRAIDEEEEDEVVDYIGGANFGDMLPGDWEE